MYEEKEHKTNDRRPVLSSSAGGRASARLGSSAGTGLSAASSKKDGEGDLLMRRKIDPDCDVIVIDIGTASIKAGWAGEDTPRCVVPALCVETLHKQPAAAGGRRGSILGLMDAAATDDKRAGAGGGEDGRSSAHIRYGSSLTASASQSAAAAVERHIGQSALSALSAVDDASPPSLLHVLQPLSRSLLSQYEALASLLDDVFSRQLCVSPKDHSLLLSVSPLASLQDRLDLARLLFERFTVPSLLLVNSASLSLYSSGLTTGVVVEMGEGRTTVVPVYEGFPLQHAVLTQRCGGQDCTERLRELLLQQRGHSFRPTQIDTLRHIKEKLCRVRQAPLRPQQPQQRQQQTQRLTSDGADAPGSAGRAASSLKSSASNSARNTPMQDTRRATLVSAATADDAAAAEDAGAYELPSGETIRLDDSCISDTLEILFTGAAQRDDALTAAAGGAAAGAGESVSWAEGVKVEDDADDGDKSAASLASSIPSTSARVRTTTSSFRLSSAQAQPADGTRPAPLPSHLSPLSSLTRDNVGLPALLVQSLSMLDPALRSVMLRQIVLAGGVSMSAGMGERVRREVVELVEALETAEGGGGAAGWDSASTTVICDSQRLHACWIGGSMIGSLSTFNQMRITADQYKKDESCIQKRFM